MGIQARGAWHEGFCIAQRISRHGFRPFSRQGGVVNGFDFTLHMRRVCEDMVTRLEPLRHVDLQRVAISFSQTRKAGSYGKHASLTALRFAGGAMETVWRGRRWRMPIVKDLAGREMLYILTFYLPRFLNLPFETKLVTIFHELWHIGPRFDGDIRRFAGRCFAHSGSCRHYDAHARDLAHRWLALEPPEPLYEFLRHDFHELVRRHGRVLGQRFRVPKLVPVE
jgi:predicted metallopeptidase